MATYVNFKSGTSSQFNRLMTKDNGTLYFLTDTQEIYKGNTLYGGGTSDKIQIKNSSQWSDIGSTIPQAGTILVYTDAMDDDGNTITDFKVADGVKNVDDLDFYSGDITGRIIQEVGITVDANGDRYFNGTANKVQHQLKIGNYTYDGSSEVEIPVYKGE